MSGWVVILAGGVGSRFWPLSTPSRPKQLLPLIDAQPLLRNTIERLLPLTRYFAYLETPDEAGGRMSSLWVEYQEIRAPAGAFSMRRVTRREEIYPVFRELFRKEVGARAA